MRLLVAAVILLGCDTPSRGPTADAGPVDFTVAGIAFHASSGGVVRTAGKLRLVLSDQADTCQALAFVPQRTMTRFSLELASGDTRAAIVGPGADAGSGQATGGLIRSTAGTTNASVDAVQGSVSIAANADGSVTILDVDAGFAGTADRLATSGLTLPGC